MTRTNFLTILSICLLANSGLFGQTTYSVDEVIARTLAHNYGLKIAQNTTTAAENNYHPGNAGLLPQITANGSYSYSNNNTKLVLAGNNPTVEQNGAESNALAGSIGLSYTLFDGLGNVYNYRKLGDNVTAAELQERANQEATIFQAVAQYISIGRLQKEVELARAQLEISRDRFTRVKTQNDFGANNSLQLLNAEVDMTSDSVSVLNAQRELENAKRDLCFLMGTPLEEDYEVEEYTTFSSDFGTEPLIQAAKENNTNVLLTSHRLLLAEWDLKIAKSTRSPRLGLTGSYGYSRQTNDASIILENRNLGFNAGVNLSFNIFNGRQTAIRIENAELAMVTQQQRINEAKFSVERDVRNSIANFRHSLSVISLAEKTLETATANFERTKTRFEAGQATGTQFREAQLNLMAARKRRADAGFSATLAEMELRFLTGALAP